MFDTSSVSSNSFELFYCEFDEPPLALVVIIDYSALWLQICHWHICLTRRALKGKVLSVSETPTNSDLSFRTITLERKAIWSSSPSLAVYLPFHTKFPQGNLKQEKIQLRNLSEQRNERSPLTPERKAIWSSRGHRHKHIF